MRKSISGSTPVIVVHDDCLHIAVSDSKNHMNRLEKISLTDFLDDSGPAMKRPLDRGSYRKSLLVVPTFWFGNAAYTLPSKKQSHIQAYLDRKLTSEHPPLSEITDYYGYYLLTNDDQKAQIYSYYLQEPSAYAIYRKVMSLGMGTPHITTPAYLCAHAVHKRQNEFFKGGKGIIHLLTTTCYLYFFNNGNFIFERSVTLPESVVSGEEKLGVVTYEINQSLYFFSQETKSTVSAFYLLSTTGESASEISSQLDKTVYDLSDVAVNKSNIDIEKDMGPATAFLNDDLTPSARMLTILPKKIKIELTWKPVQLTGIICGIFLLAVLLAESVFIWNQTTLIIDAAHSSESQYKTPRDMIRDYGNALEYLIAEKNRHSASDIIVKIAHSMPDNMWAKKLSIDLEKQTHVSLESILHTGDENQLQPTLNAMIKGFNTNFERDALLSMNGIAFKPDGTSTLKNTFVVSFDFNL